MLASNIGVVNESGFVFTMQLFEKTVVGCSNSLLTFSKALMFTARRDMSCGAFHHTGIYI